MASESITDPQGRYVRSSEELGRGAYKVVYKAIDRDLGLEVAWNQIRLEQGTDFEKLWKEINILEQLKHPNIIVFHHSWVDEEKFQVIFITEFMTSGTLKQFIKKAQGVRLKVIKNWCLQILDGLNYLHTRDPPIIHRDIKCDNIFINGSLGQVKIGDLGLATILNQSGAMMKQSIIGTPEFMAPEYYEEKYDEKVDIWAFGMSVLEMATMDYPFCECDNPAQIFKKVSTGQKPRSLARIADPDVYSFIDDCLQSVEHRASAAELLRHPFLQNIDDEDNRLIELRSETETTEWLERIKKDALPFEYRPSWQKAATRGGPKPITSLTTGQLHPSEAGVQTTPIAPVAAPLVSQVPIVAPAAGVSTLQSAHVVVSNPDDIAADESEEEEEEEFDFDGEYYEDDDEEDLDEDVALSHTTPPIMPVGAAGFHPHPLHQTPTSAPAAVVSAHVHQHSLGQPAVNSAPTTSTVATSHPPVHIGHAPMGGLVHSMSQGHVGEETISLKIDAGWTAPGTAPTPATADPNAVNLKCSLMIGRQVTVIEFEYNIMKDTPVLVAAEMVRELQLGDTYVPEIAAYLEAKVAEYVQQRNLPVQPVPEDRLRALREQLMHQIVSETLRLNSPRRAAPQSRLLADQAPFGVQPGIRRAQSANTQRKRRMTEGANTSAQLAPRASASAGASTGSRPQRPSRTDSSGDVASRHVRRKSRTKVSSGLTKSQSQSDVLPDSEGATVVVTDTSRTDPIVQSDTVHLEELQDFKKLVESNNANFENALAAFEDAALPPGLDGPIISGSEDVDPINQKD